MKLSLLGRCPPTLLFYGTPYSTATTVNITSSKSTNILNSDASNHGSYSSGQSKYNSLNSRKSGKWFKSRDPSPSALKVPNYPSQPNPGQVLANSTNVQIRQNSCRGSPRHKNRHTIHQGQEKQALPLSRESSNMSSHAQHISGLNQHNSADNEYVKLRYNANDGTMFCQDPNMLNSGDFSNLPAPPPKPSNHVSNGHSQNGSPRTPTGLPYGHLPEQHTPIIPGAPASIRHSNNRRKESQSSSHTTTSSLNAAVNSHLTPSSLNSRSQSPNHMNEKLWEMNEKMREMQENRRKVEHGYGQLQYAEVSPSTVSRMKHRGQIPSSPNLLVKGVESNYEEFDRTTSPNSKKRPPSKEHLKKHKSSTNPINSAQPIYANTAMNQTLSVNQQAINNINVQNQKSSQIYVNQHQSHQNNTNSNKFHSTGPQINSSSIVYANEDQSLNGTTNQNSDRRSELPLPPKIPAAPGEATLKRKKQDLEFAYTNLLDMGGNQSCYAVEPPINQPETINHSIQSNILKTKHSSPKDANRQKTSIRINKKSFASSILSNSDLEEVSSLSSNEIVSMPRSPTTSPHSTPQYIQPPKSGKLQTRELHSPSKDSQKSRRSSSGRKNSIRRSESLRDEKNGSQIRVRKKSIDRERKIERQEIITNNHVIEARGKPDLDRGQSTPSKYRSRKNSANSARSRTSPEKKMLNSQTPSPQAPQTVPIKLKKNSLNFQINNHFNFYIPYKESLGNFSLSGSNIDEIVPLDQLVNVTLNEHCVLSATEKCQQENNQLICLHELMAFPLLYITIETIGLERVRHFVPIPKDKVINPEKDFNPFGKAGMMMYCALLLDHFVNRHGIKESENGLIGTNSTFEFDDSRSASENIVLYVHEMIHKLFLDDSTESEDSAFAEKVLSSESSRSPVKSRNLAHTSNGHSQGNSRSLSCDSNNSIEDSAAILSKDVNSKNDTNGVDLSNHSNDFTNLQQQQLYCDNYMYNLKRVCAHDDLTLGHWLASKKCFPVQQLNNESKNSSLAGGAKKASQQAKELQEVDNNLNTNDINTENPINLNSSTSFEQPTNDFVNSQINNLQESLQVHASLDAFLQLSCTASSVTNALKIIKRSILKIESILEKKLNVLLNQVSI